jgi:hypothetical protein
MGIASTESFVGERRWFLVMDANDDPPSQSLGGTYASLDGAPHEEALCRSNSLGHEPEHPIFIPGTWTYARTIAGSPFADIDKSELLASRIYSLN